MSKPICYLAGPIAGTTLDDQDWRTEAWAALLGDFQVLSPLRGKHQIFKRSYGGSIDSDYRKYSHEGCNFGAEGIMARDFNDVRRADVILANLSDWQPGVSIGTAMELAWAYADRTPAVCVLDDDSPVLKHPMLTAAVGPFRCSELADAVVLVRQLMGVA